MEEGAEERRASERVWDWIWKEQAPGVRGESEHWGKAELGNETLWSVHGCVCRSGRENNLCLAEGAHRDHSNTEWAMFEGTTVAPNSLLKQDHPRAHCTGS